MTKFSLIFLILIHLLLLLVLSKNQFGYQECTHYDDDSVCKVSQVNVETQYVNLPVGIVACVVVRK